MIVLITYQDINDFIYLLFVDEIPTKSSGMELGSKFRGGQNFNKKNSLKYKLAYI